MAEAEEKESDGEEGAEDKESKKGGLGKILLLAGIGLLLVGVSVGGTLFFLGAFSKEETGEEMAAEEGEQVEVKAEAIYLPLQPPFIANYDVRGRQRYLQTSVSIMTREQDVVEAVEQHMPLVRNELVLLLSGQVYEELQTEEGRELLRQSALEAVQGIMETEIGKPGVEQILFTDFVMQ